MDAQLMEMQKDIKNLVEAVKDLKTAVVGSPVTKDGGLVKRIEDLENQVEDLKTKFIKNDIYLRWIWALGGFAGSALFTYVLKIIFK